MLHLFCEVNPPTYISTRDRPRYWPGAGVFSKESAGEEKGLAQRQDREGVFSKESVLFGTKAGLKPVHDGIGRPVATSWSTMGP